MFEQLKPAAPDAILALMALFRDDPRPGKVDLGVGVYRAADGTTPVMRSVREAERRLYETQTTKSYLGLAGDPAFNAHMIGLVFGEGADRGRIRACQTPGGTGALRVLAELIRLARPGATVWTPDPTWPNHLPILRAAGLVQRSYPYFDAQTAGVRFGAMAEALTSAAPGDVVLLHGCCHNPTGANLTPGEWEEIAGVLERRGLVPFVDLAYQGFGDGFEEDAAGVRLLASRLPELMVASSCSKNFSIYRERTGSALVMGATASAADAADGQMQAIARANYSMPPDHGAACVRIILDDAALRADWRAELEAVRLRMLSLRENFAEALRRQSNSDRFDFVATHRGMFSRLPLSGEQVARLRAEHGVYMVGDGRFNVAGLPGDRLDGLAASIVSVL